MTLAEFLLARIAEDEASARRLTSEAFPRLAPNGYWLEPKEQSSSKGRQKVLAECEAKRQIIDWFQVTEDPSLDSMPWQVMKKVLACLALPYAEHPDYRQDWALQPTAR